MNENRKQQAILVLFEMYRQGGIAFAEQCEDITPEMIERFNQKFTLENPTILQLLESMADICLDEDLGPIFGGFGNYIANKP